MARYKIAEKWGGGEANTAAACGCIFVVPEGWRLVQRDSGGQAMFPHDALTELPSPFPAEPGPGPWSIDGTFVWHDPRWKVAGPKHHWRVLGETRFISWEEVWALLGGPDVTIKPLVALPEVELGWSEGPVGVGFDSHGLGGGPHKVVVRAGATEVNIVAPVAEEMAAALWTAARAAWSAP